MNNLSIFTNVGQMTGYSIYATNLINYINKHLPVHLHSPMPQQADILTVNMVNRSNSKTLPDISYSIASPMDALRFHGKKRVFTTMWETTKLPQHFVNALKTVDLLISPSEWMRDIFIGNGIDAEKIKVVKGGIDPKRFKPKPKYIKEQERPFTFLTVGKFERRKASIETVRGFLEAFKPEDNVQLNCKFTSPVTMPLREIKETLHPLFDKYGKAMSDKVKLVADVPNIESIYKDVDCFILPSKAEGLGLPILEAMASGLPIISTPYTSHQEYLDPSFATILPNRGLEAAYDPRYGIHPMTHGQWGKVLVEDVIVALRTIYELPEEKRLEMGRAAREYVDQFSWANTATTFTKTIQEFFNG